MRWHDKTKQTETRRNSEIHQPTNVPFIVSILSPPVLNTEGGRQRDLRPAYNSSSEQNISGQTEMRSTHKPHTSRRSQRSHKKELQRFFKSIQAP